MSCIPARVILHALQGMQQPGEPTGMPVTQASTHACPACQALQHQHRGLTLVSLLTWELNTLRPWVRKLALPGSSSRPCPSALASCASCGPAQLASRHARCSKPPTASVAWLADAC